MHASSKQLIIFATQMTQSGGIENHIVRLCEHMQKRGLGVVFFCPDYRLSHELDRRLAASCDEVVVLRPRCGKEPVWKRLIWSVWKVLLLRKRVDGVLYLNGQGALPYWVAKGLRGKTRRTVVHHHSSGDSADIATWPNNYMTLLKQADVVIACSKTNADSISKVIRKAAMTIYCYSEPCELPNRPTRETDLHFGFFGRLIPEKGVSTILRLSREKTLAEISWHLWGPLEGYPEGFTDDYPNVTLHAAFHNKEGLRAALSQLDAFVLYSTHSEGLPLTILEAMSAGLPWIASDRGGVRDLVVDNVSTLLLSCNFTYQEAFEATQSLSRSIRLGAVDARKLKTFYRDRFAPDKVTSEWLRILDGNS